MCAVKLGVHRLESRDAPAADFTAVTMPTWDSAEPVHVSTERGSFKSVDESPKIFSGTSATDSYIGGVEGSWEPETPPVFKPVEVSTGDDWIRGGDPMYPEEAEKDCSCSEFDSKDTWGENFDREKLPEGCIVGEKPESEESFPPFEEPPLGEFPLEELPVESGSRRYPGMPEGFRFFRNINEFVEPMVVNPPPVTPPSPPQPTPPVGAPGNPPLLSGLFGTNFIAPQAALGSQLFRSGNFASASAVDVPRNYPEQPMIPLVPPVRPMDSRRGPLNYVEPSESDESKDVKPTEDGLKRFERELFFWRRKEVVPKEEADAAPKAAEGKELQNQEKREAAPGQKFPEPKDTPKSKEGPAPKGEGSAELQPGRTILPTAAPVSSPAYEVSEEQSSPRSRTFWGIVTAGVVAVSAQLGFTSWRRSWFSSGSQTGERLERRNPHI